MDEGEKYQYLSEAQRSRLQEVERLREAFEVLIRTPGVSFFEDLAVKVWEDLNSLSLERETILLYQLMGEYKDSPDETIEQFSEKVIALRAVTKKIKEALKYVKELPFEKVEVFQNFLDEFSTEITRDIIEILFHGIAILDKVIKDDIPHDLKQQELEVINKYISIALGAGADLSIDLEVYQDKLDQLGWVDPYQ